MLANRICADCPCFTGFRVFSSGLGMILALFLLLTMTVAAREIAGVRIPEQARVAGAERPLVLNGAGIRKKFFFSIYVAGLYLPHRTQDAAEAMSMPGPKRVSMAFVYSEIPAKKLASAWREGFEENLSAAERREHGAAIRAFWSMFPTVRSGDEVVIDEVPGEGVVVRLNGAELGRIEEPGFMPLLLRIWLGSEPVTRGLKRELLGSGA